MGQFVFIKHKNTCGGMLISVKVAGWFTASLKLTLKTRIAADMQF